jgi:hypothetical protein
MELYSFPVSSQVVALLMFEIEVPGGCGEGILTDLRASLLLSLRGLSANPASRFTQLAAKQYWANGVSKYGWLEALAQGDVESQWFGQEGLLAEQLTRTSKRPEPQTGILWPVTKLGYKGRLTRRYL